MHQASLFLSLCSYLSFGFHALCVLCGEYSVSFRDLNRPLLSLRLCASARYILRMDHWTPFTFAIVGGGLTATSTLCQVVDRLARLSQAGTPPARKLSIVVFEKKGVFGPGLPHSDQVVLPFHITNMRAEDMSVRADEPGDFQAWVQQHHEVFEGLPCDPADPAAGKDGREAGGHHYPRAVMGAYLKSRFKGAAETARSIGISVELCADREVIDLCPEEQQYRIVTRAADGTSEVHKADAVLLATGHWFETSDNDRYVPSPWPAARLLHTIPEGQQVGVIGSSLSAVEVVLTLTSDGRFTREADGALTYAPPPSPRKLTLLSRNGLLPRVRGRIGQSANRYLTCDVIRRLIQERPGAIKLASVFELLDRELTAAYGSATDWEALIHPTGTAAETLRQDIHNARNGDGPDGELIWQTVLVEIFPVVRALYLNLTLAERERFDRKFNTLFFMHAATQPVINAEKLLALMEAGIVSIVRLGETYQFNLHGPGGPFEFSYTDPQGGAHRDTYQYVVNACGQPRSVASDPAELPRNLRQRGLIHTGESRIPPAYKTGSIVIDPLTHRVIPKTAEGLPRLPLYAIGAMTRGQMIDASMAQGLIRSTAAAAEDLLSLL